MIHDQSTQASKAGVDISLSPFYFIFLKMFFLILQIDLIGPDSSVLLCKSIGGLKTI